MNCVGVLTVPILETVDGKSIKRSEGKGMPVDNEEGRLFVVRH